MSKKTIMIVDDEALILESVGEILSKEGYNVIKALSGPEALAKLRKRKVNLVLTDVMMPSMGGIELTKKIRKDPEFKDINLAFLTIISFSKDQKQKLKNFKISDYIQKPFDSEDLIKRVNKITKKLKK